MDKARICKRMRPKWMKFCQRVCCEIWFWKWQGLGMRKMGSDFHSIREQKLSVDGRLNSGDKAERVILPLLEEK